VATPPGGQGKILLLMDERGFQPLPHPIPTVWVTVPTQEVLDLGFAVNAHFELDVGRAQLARTSVRNEELGRILAAGFGDVLIELFEATEHDWVQVRSVLGLAGSVSRYSFWKSFWEVVSTGMARALAGQPDGGATSPATDLLSRILWKDRRGAAAILITSQSVLPTYLPDRHAVTTSLRQIRFVVRGILLRRPGLFEPISAWPEIAERVAPGTAVSAMIFERLLKLLPEDPISMSIDLTLREALAWVLNPVEFMVDPALADRLGRAVSRASVDLASADKDERDEVADLQRRVLFKTSGDAYRPAQVLMARDAGDSDAAEESRRAAFAPQDRVLNRDYVGDALEFFRFCRQSLLAVSTDELAAWVRSAHTQEGRLAAMVYLCEGERGNDVCIRLRVEPCDWLLAVLETPQAFGIETNRWAILLGLLGQADRIPQPTPSAPPPPARHLQRLFTWWSENRTARLPQFLRTIYPDGQPIRVSDLDRGSRDLPARRKEWIQLFLLGAAQTIGRTRDEQNRDSLDRLDLVITELAVPDLRDATWLQRLEQYLDEQQHNIEYFQWIKEFVGAFAIARRLDDYVEGFRLLNHTLQRLDQVTRLRESELLTGTGIDAPPISNVLGVGVCFVVRELVRQEFITHPNAHRYCYMPVRRLRTMMTHLGCPGLEEGVPDRWEQSRSIHEFLERELGPEQAIFCGDFDIPFLVIWRNPTLRQEWFPNLGSD
jgi:hypothetical protein